MSDAELMDMSIKERNEVLDEYESESRRSQHL